MKRKDIQQLKQAAVSELEAKLREARSKMQSLSFDRELGKLKNAREIQALKKDIARMLTFKKQKEAATIT